MKNFEHSFNVETVIGDQDLSFEVRMSYVQDEHDGEKWNEGLFFQVFDDQSREVTNMIATDDPDLYDLIVIECKEHMDHNRGLLI